MFNAINRKSKCFFANNSKETRKRFDHQTYQNQTQNQVRERKEEDKAKTGQ